jgi:hypothetical protein
MWLAGEYRFFFDNFSSYKPPVVVIYGGFSIAMFDSPRAHHHRRDG